MNFVLLACVQREALESEIINLQTVAASPCSALALIIDHDLGFLMWLGEVFVEAGFQAVPALHCRQALAMAKRLNRPITTLVLNPELPGAARTVKALAAANPAMRVVLIRNSPAHSDAPSAPHDMRDDAARPSRTNPNGIRARSTLERPSPEEPISRPVWVSKIRKMLVQRSVEKNF